MRHRCYQRCRKREIDDLRRMFCDVFVLRIRGDTDALDILVAKADKDARKTSGYDPRKYVGTYVATSSSQNTVRAS